MYSSRFYYLIILYVHVTFGAAKGLDSSVRSWRGSLPVLNILDHQGSPKIITHDTQKEANGKKHQDTQIRSNQAKSV